MDSISTKLFLCPRVDALFTWPANNSFLLYFAVLRKFLTDTRKDEDVLLPLVPKVIPLQPEAVSDASLHTFPNALKACDLVGELTLDRQIHLCLINSGFEDSCYCLVAVIDIDWNCKLLDRVHRLDITSGYELNCVLGSTLIDLYAKQGSINKALRLFERLLDKDVVAWFSLIAGCARVTSDKLVLFLFMDMVQWAFQNDHFVLAIVLEVSSSLASHNSGKLQFHFAKDSALFVAIATISKLLLDFSKKQKHGRQYDQKFKLHKRHITYQLVLPTFLFKTLFEFSELLDK